MKLHLKLSNFIDYFRPKDNIKTSLVTLVNIFFWIAVFIILLINFYSTREIFTYSDNHDHHLAFISYLGGMAANGILPGIDFYSPHSVLIPIIFGFFFKFLGVSQVSLGISDGIIIFITMIFIYKTARFVMPNIFAKLSVLTLLLSHTGRDNPWFNDVIMLFVAIGAYFFASYLIDKKRYKLIILGIICFMLPFLRQQGIVISFLILALPLILFYTHQIIEVDYKTMTKKIFFSFISANFLFFIFIFIRNGFEGLEILFSSFGSLVAMAQPSIPYDRGFNIIVNSMFNYTSDGMDWHGYFMRFLSYWFIVIIPCIYFMYRPFSLFASKKAILNEDSIKFVVAIITFSTIIFNYPINEDARMRVQFGIGIWLFIESLRLCFYNKNIKFISAIAIGIVFLFINHPKITQFIDRTVYNYRSIAVVKNDHYKMGSNTPYSDMMFRSNYATHLQKLLSSIESYHQEHPERMIIFDGELIDINAYLFLLFSGPKVALQHKFPYYYGVFDREEFFININDEFNKFISSNNPIIIGCAGLKDDKHKIPQGYKILNNINKSCDILVPID